MFVGATGPVPLDDVANWWEYRPGAYWKRPGGKGTTINGRDNHPVTHVALEDVEAYAAGRASRSLPRRSGSGRLVAASKAPPSRGATSTSPMGKCMANTWQGEFPWQNLKLDGYERTSPVEELPAERVRPLRHHGKRVGVDERLVHVCPRRAVALSLLRCPNPQVADPTRGDTERPGRGVPTQGDQGRLPSLRSELLLALPPRGPASADDRHVDLPSRIPLHHARVIEVRTGDPRLSLQCVVEGRMSV